MTQPAWIYARFSSLEQSKGHSLERQLEDGRAYIHRMGWEHSPKREIADEGKSAYHGANRAEGSGLHEFEQKAREGHFNNGAVLVLENIDRLTRQGYEEAIDLLRLFTTNGVTVATWHDNQIYNAGERIDMMKVMSVILKAELAHEESDKKSKRIRASWMKKIASAQNGDRTAMTKILPAWLERTTDNQMAIIPYRVTVLNEIYDWYCDGRGLPWIVNHLNSRKEATWGYGAKANSAGWNTAYLHKLLTMRTVLGEFEPMARPRSAMYETTKGIIIPDFYPQVISPDKFNRVQALRKQRAKWGGPATKAMNNLFGGIARCSCCGGMMYYSSNMKAGRPTGHKSKLDGRPLNYICGTDRSYFKCNNARRNHQCDNKTNVRYEMLESEVLRTLMPLAMGQTLDKPTDKQAALTSQIAEQERQIEVKQKQLENVMENLMSFASKALAQKAAQLEEEIEEHQQAIVPLRRNLERERGAARPDEYIEQLIASQAALSSTDADIRYGARVKTHQALTGLIKSMECDRDGNTHIVIGQDVLMFSIGPKGDWLGSQFLQEEIIGPDGERNWHPDEEAAE